MCADNDITIAVTGSSGFIGSYFVKHLESKGTSVIKLDITEGVDLTKWDQVRQTERFDVLFHLAGKTFVPASYAEPRAFYHDNLISTLNALELCRLHEARMILASSYVYGVPQYLPIDEDHPVNAINPYALSKIMCEDLCKGYYRDFGVPVMIFRQSNVYGHGQNLNFLIPKIVEQAQAGKINLMDSTPKRDFVYVDDVISAYIKGLTDIGVNFEIFNIGSGESYSVSEIVKMVVSHFSESIQVHYSGEKRAVEIPDTCYNISKAKEMLNWNPRIDIRDGITKMINYRERS
ncbi:MAG: NAD-dependent epimerase/dehydratase family protein [candidate division KSB1 bacterium]|jgi:UDP-glucose 4-epimerase|nr:NAD-dependent epimerase/dehydratase family protein [candidate division KSB1 bacterium]